MMAALRRTVVFVLLATIIFTFPAEITASPALIQTAGSIIPNPSALARWLDQVDQARLMAHVAALENCFTRYVNSTGAHPGYGIDAAYDYIDGQFEAIYDQHPQVEVWAQSFSLHWDGQRSAPRNIVITLPGTDPAAAQIIIGAHYDTYTTVSRSNPYAHAPGANDNGSGVAALIELARILSTTPHRRTIMLVAFAAEEEGDYGSAAFVNDVVKRQHIPLAAMINLDVVGSAWGHDASVTNAHEIRVFSADPNDSPSRRLARTLQAYAALYVTDMHVVVQNALDRPGRWGDHKSFSLEGYPAVRFTAALENDYHEDTVLDRMADVDPDYLQRATRTVLAVVIALAEQPDGLPAPGGLSVVSDSSGAVGISWTPVPNAAGYVIAVRHQNSVAFDEEIEVVNPPVVWSDLSAAGYASFVVAAKDANGLVGCFSGEYDFAET